MILSARPTARPCKRVVCESFEGRHGIRGSAIRLYGMAHQGEKPWPVWLCPGHAAESLKYIRDPRYARLVAIALCRLAQRRAL